MPKSESQGPEFCHPEQDRTRHPARQAQAELLPRLARHFFTKVVELPEGHQPDTVDEKKLKETLVQLIS